MTLEKELLKMARECALEAKDFYNYVPKTKEESLNWEPHDWVMVAMQHAWQAGVNEGYDEGYKDGGMES